MENNIDVMKQILELTESMQQGLDHIRNQVNEGYFETTTVLISDVFSAFATIENSVWSCLENNQKEELEGVFDTLRNGFDVLTKAYEQESVGKALEILQFNVLPNAKRWKDALEKSFQPYVLC